ncbi:MAG: TolC family protein [Myxococcaceae bacterium]
MCSSSLLVALLAAAVSGPEVTLDQALALAVEGNARLKVSRSEVELSRAQVVAAHPWEMPKLRAQLQRIDDISINKYSWYTSLAWTPPNPWEWSSGTDAAEARLAQAQFDLAALQWDMEKDLRLAWLDVSGAASHERVAHDALMVRRTLIDLLTRRLAKGQGTQIELNLANLVATDARQDELRFQSDALKASQAVAWLVGQVVTPVPAALPDEPPAIPPVDQLMTRLERHPALLALQQRVNAASAAERVVIARRLPWPEVQVRLKENVNATPSFDFTAGIAVPLAITPAPQLEVARAQTARLQAQLDAERAQMKSELQILHIRAESLRERWLSFEQDYRATITSHRQLQARVLNDGSLDPTLLLNADRQAIDLEHKRLEVHLDLARTLVELEAVAGPREAPPPK